MVNKFNKNICKTIGTLFYFVSGKDRKAQNFIQNLQNKLLK